ncbi:hypothetical protein DPM13_09355 [Paracoccus mutanolyticus]|uniref:DUF2934 domain-containing protein n=1 Tax=Paracoccus mutanolyticus TaxID=1499308 RepID=A0ABM6WRP1_9RHOB|nr:hypothetical protein DPM13_09355 [Paracoccus mutanolyticus]
MQRALGAWLEAERDLAHSGSWDPACDHWLRDAEAARAAVGAALDALCEPLPNGLRTGRCCGCAADPGAGAQRGWRELPPHVVGRPLALLRCPGGIAARAEVLSEARPRRG